MATDIRHETILPARFCPAGAVPGLGNPNRSRFMRLPVMFPPGFIARASDRVANPSPLNGERAGNRRHLDAPDPGSAEAILPGGERYPALSRRACKAPETFARETVESVAYVSALAGPVAFSGGGRP